ncbi:MAG: hypothetical protein Kow00124_27840 [Anaerolineae bacterium]
MLGAPARAPQIDPPRLQVQHTGPAGGDDRPLIAHGASFARITGLLRVITQIGPPGKPFMPDVIPGGEESTAAERGCDPIRGIVLY